VLVYLLGLPSFIWGGAVCTHDPDITFPHKDSVMMLSSKINSARLFGGIYSIMFSAVQEVLVCSACMLIC